MRIPIEVGPQHIRNGNHGSMGCPVALAIRDSFSYYQVRGQLLGVTGSYISLELNGRQAQRYNPWPLTERISEWDGAGYMQPFTFFIDVESGQIYAD